MIKNLLSKVGWGDLPGSFGFTVGEKVELPFRWHWDLHRGQKKSDGSVVSIFICSKKDLDSFQISAAKNAEQMAKALRHPNILRSLDSIEVEGGFYLVTEAVVPLLSFDAAESDDGGAPAIWGFYQAMDALGFLHQSGFTHGLFGPASIFVTPQGDFRLGGFDLCRKDASADALLAGWRRSSPGISAWPEPPSSLKSNGTPTVGIDLWGATLLAAYIFGSAGASQRGVDYRVDLARLPKDLPAELRKPVADLQKQGPLRGKNPVADLLKNSFFDENSSVQVMSFLNNIHIKSPEEKDAFFEGLPALLENVPRSQQTRQVLPELLTAQKFPGQEAAQVLPAILKIGVRLKDDEFKEKVAPLVVQLFQSPDRAIRFRLLTSIGDMIDSLDDSMINDKIFTECVNGFTDSNGPIREATVKSLIHFVPRLRPKTVEGRVTKLLLRSLQDPEASIRTNTVICCGRISGHLPKACANQTLGQVLAAGLKDNFGPCRSAALHTLLATAVVFTPEELAGRLMPCVCQRLVDTDPSVADAAFNALSALEQHVRQEVEERRRAQSMEPILGDQTATVVGVGDAASLQGRLGSWASTVGNMVGQKIMGSMKTDGGVASGNPARNSSSSEPAVNSGGEGMNLRPKEAAAVSDFSGGNVSNAWESRVDLASDSADLGGSGWGEEAFWDEFKDLAADPPPPRKESTMDSNPPAANTGPRKGPSAASSAPKSMSMSMGPSPTMQKNSPASNTQAKAQPQKDGILQSDDSDFWKEFDM
mmetsp:Transcript_41374/g.81741  ORF Transcript_41374/g.81741 Transcript_41374/m.81741 type:complete len:762 (+) Transcript_41374:112-2397(+)|eukprot:CAMPEP_0172750420 /NCGR_PEP_ID=MMETSP1074-20121228/149528_1 /TAXON_ID=2916 /ORGANISM="Ceratium fusus, Strain PA161109" /LENGTH=761 /DNA_ID=CAMNT_0013582557 /DNA_START=42 /DNA_END=2327 /DNA_ORIENTATION=-